MSTTVKTLNLKNLIIDPSVQPRDSLNREVITRYAELYRGGETDFPPLRVHEINGEHYLCDGFTRHAGATEAGTKTHRCDIRENSTRGALMIDAVRLNSIHGQPLTQSERRRAVARLVKAHDESGVKWTQKDIAAIVGVDQATVSRVLSDELEGKIEAPPPTLADDEPDFVQEAANRMLNDEESTDDEPELSAKEKEVQQIIEKGRTYPDMIYQACREITAHLRMCQHTPGCESVVQNMATLVQAKETLLSIREMRPEVVCPNCNGHGCNPCHQRGWLNRNESKRIR